jgi:hypothetical protein
MLQVTCIIALLFALCPLRSEAADKQEAMAEYPMLQLVNGELTMRLYLPDAELGFYRGVRFDWSGIIERVTYKGHRFYAPWKKPHDPEGNDNVSGPAEEFAMSDPMGYAEAAPGESFVKIGVGLLERIDEKDYHFFGKFKILRAGEWQVRSGGDWVEFKQDLVGERGWAYRYTKRISLGEDEPTFSIYHKLENTGSKTIDINHYNHNFTSIDGVPYGPDYSVTFPFSTAEPRPLRKELAWYSGNAIEVVEPLGDRSTGKIDLRGPGGVELNASTIRNNKTGAQVSFVGDVPISEFRFWSVATAACPEPFIQLTIEPGNAKEWNWHYTLSADNER